MNASVTQDMREKLRYLEDENDLMLQHLHQVQEELEHYHVLSQEYERKIADLNRCIEQPMGANKRALTLFQRLTDWLGITVHRQVNAIKASGFFDKTWYLGQNPDVGNSSIDPAEHYLRHGAKEGRNPGPQFDSHWYLSTYPDVAIKGMNPLLHYLRHGRVEGRQPCAEGLRTADPFVLERQWLQQARDREARLAAERQAQLDQANQSYTTLAAERAELERQLATLTRTLDEQTRLSAERQAQLDQANQSHTTLAAERAELERQLATLTRTLDEQTRLSAERQVELVHLQELAEQEQNHVDAQLMRIREMLEL